MSKPPTRFEFESNALHAGDLFCFYTELCVHQKPEPHALTFTQLSENKEKKETGF